jgi:peptidoglycan/xylan/chitin deacetylase (PgdA/CDA1 family)
MYFHHPPQWLRGFFPQIIWNLPTDEKIIYLSFDDGPEPSVTPRVLDLLRTYNAKASFFCIGENAVKHKSLLEEVRSEGHTIGNHSFTHMNGWRTGINDYLADVEKCRQIIGGRLFRPPYGKITPIQLRALAKDYRVVLWDVLSGDFDLSLKKERCLQKVMKYTKKGSIPVFHDSIKASEKLMFVLPEILKHYSLQGFKFNAIPEK